MRRTIWATFLTLGLCASAAWAQLPPPGLEVGQRFPNIAFRDVESGRAVSIDDFRGAKVLVAVFASW